jgi:hypothetical protein
VFVYGAAEREVARKLRADGWSIRAIAGHLGIAASTASLWVRDVPPPAGRTEDDVARQPTRSLPTWTSGQVRRCSRCGLVLPDVLFNRHGSGHQWWCRSCFVGYQRGRRQTDRLRAHERVRIARAFLLEHLERTGCMDCGCRDPVVLEFDHVGEKRSLVSELARRGVPVARIQHEIDECEVVCANCHRKRTCDRARSWRSGGGGASSRPLRERNFAHLRAVLTQAGCCDCGERDVRTLEFDHVGPKTAAVTALAQRESSLARIDEEIAQTVVRCSNCHRRKTGTERGYFRSTRPEHLPS